MGLNQPLLKRGNPPVSQLPPVTSLDTCLLAMSRTHAHTHTSLHTKHMVGSVICQVQTHMTAHTRRQRDKQNTLGYSRTSPHTVVPQMAPKHETLKETTLTYRIYSIITRNSSTDIHFSRYQCVGCVCFSEPVSPAVCLSWRPSNTVNPVYSHEPCDQRSGLSAQ